MKISNQLSIFFVAIVIGHCQSKETDRFSNRKNLRVLNNDIRKNDKFLSKSCTIQVRDTLQLDGTSVTDFDCELDTADTDGVEGVLVRIKKGRERLADIHIVPGITTIFSPDSYVREHYLHLGPKVKIEVGSEELTNRRNLAARTGDRKILIVRVNANGDSQTVTDSEAKISDSVFSNGVDGDGADLVSLKTQYEACSASKLRFQPVLHPSIPNGTGIITVDLAESASDGDADLVNAAGKAAAEQLTVASLGSIADHVMYCLPEAAMSGIAYAYFNYYISVYSDKWCTYVSAQMHEIGHNLGLAHSSEGGVSYQDKTGLMGLSYKTSDTKMCFNNAKNWDLKWYENREITVDPLVAGWTGELVGVVDYISSTDSQVVVLKIDGGALGVNDQNRYVDYYVGYNRASSFNSATREGQNRVTVQSQGRAQHNWDFPESSLLAKLSVGENLIISGLTTIVVNSIDESSGVATITIDGPSMVSDPTPQPTEAPTTVPTTSPTSSPTTSSPASSPTSSENSQVLLSCETFMTETFEIGWSNGRTQTFDAYGKMLGRWYFSNNNNIQGDSKSFDVSNFSSFDNIMIRFNLFEFDNWEGDENGKVIVNGNSIGLGSFENNQNGNVETSRSGYINGISWTLEAGQSKFSIDGSSQKDQIHYVTITVPRDVYVESEDINLEFSFDLKENKNQESAGITDLVMEACTASQPGTPAPAPTDVPTPAPTNAPTTLPTATPTVTPTDTPTPAPTESPTAVPTAAPTASPTASPTSSPKASPTASPTALPTPNLCSPSITGKSEVCSENEKNCIVMADLRSGSNSRENCNTYCNDLGLECTGAWNEKNKKCIKKKKIDCSTVNSKFSICKCQVPMRTTTLG